MHTSLLSRRVCLLGLVLWLSLVLIKSGVHAQWATSPAWTTFVPTTAVSYAISTDRNSYSVRDKITLKYRIVNISNRPLYVPRSSLEGCPWVSRHVSAWFEDGAGRRNPMGYGGSCASTPGAPKPTVTERMNKEAVLLKPAEHFDATVQLVIPSEGGSALPGEYRIESILSGWTYDEFTDKERIELANIGSSFLRGEIPASMHIRLTP